MLGGGERPRLVPGIPSGTWLPAAMLPNGSGVALVAPMLLVGLLGASPTGDVARGYPGRWLMVFLMLTGIPPPTMPTGAGELLRTG